MRALRRSFLLLALFTLATVTLAFSTVTGSAAESPRIWALQAADLELTLSVGPRSIEPGQEATATVTLKNLSPTPIAPEVQIVLPGSVSTKLQELPAATFYNAQNGTISWQPVMGGEGAQAELLLTIVAQVADVNVPEQLISASVKIGDYEIRQDAQFWVGLSPSASIKLEPPQVSVGQPIHLISDVTGPDSETQIWSLGDGRIVEAKDPVVVYASPGLYEIVLQVDSPQGPITAQNIVTVVAQSIARFSVPDATPRAGDPVTFLNESGGQPPLSYLWEFGDGLTSTDSNPVHHFFATGMHEVRLTVSGPGGTSEAVHSVLVGQAPVADFVIAAVVDAGSVVQAQAFTDETVTSVEWDMGDGREYDGDLIEHVYWSAGDYVVSARFANEFGETVIQHPIVVNRGALYLFLPLVSSIDAGDPILVPINEIQVNETPAADIEATGHEATGTAAPGEELPLMELPPELGRAEQLLAYINEARRINGLAPLNLVHELSIAAQSHADDMATSGFTGHGGSDGSVPALRVQLSGYPGGYAGEATAWGMAEAVAPVRFWLSSPGHRPIILDPEATDVGVGFSENMSSPSVWYWTAEFASLNLPVIRIPLSEVPEPDPVINLLGPPRESEFLLSTDTNLIFTWSWPMPLAADERFAVYLKSRGRVLQLGTVSLPQLEDQYQFAISAANVPVLPGQQQWHVRLEETLGSGTRFESEAWPITFVSPQ